MLWWFWELLMWAAYAGLFLAIVGVFGMVALWALAKNIEWYREWRNTR